MALCGMATGTLALRTTTTTATCSTGSRGNGPGSGIYEDSFSQRTQKVPPPLISTTPYTVEDR
ncbi:myosin-X [Anopheles sinensis]|uniref:Myosin-X n=1 Tax=Anopheles sinensis TaxID=74873 RepID=A0A084W9Q1_ANOSI|nr:myosin-X [Anopheles sinensis]